MSSPSIQQLHKALSHDLKKLGAEGSQAVVNDEARKTFSARINGAIFVFAHKQADPGYWSGVKHYGSGPSNRFRMSRTPVAMPTAEAKTKAKKAPRRSPVAAEV